MGSFTSATKILNEDCQDDDVNLATHLSHDELLTRCRNELSAFPPLFTRHFQSLSTDRQPRDDCFDLSLGCDQVDNVDRSAAIRVLQWNILSQSLGVMNDNFVSCPDDALDWHTRRYRIIEEIISYTPDIICLQEVDHFNFLTKVLATQGYRGMFFPKPDSPCLYINGNNGPDGCAIFYRDDKYEFVRLESRVLEVWRVQSNQVAMAVILRVRDTGVEFCVATTHLKARHGALLSTLRNEQGKDLLDFVANEAQNRPLILCGDFNAEPTEPVYATILKYSQLNLASAYASTNYESISSDDNFHVLSCENEPAYTTWKIREEGEVCHTIDYVFYSRDKLTVNGILEFPSGEDIGEARIPSYAYPSDHFSLVCDFRFTNIPTHSKI